MSWREWRGGALFAESRNGSLGVLSCTVPPDPFAFWATVPTGQADG